jgi:hypothetical protein
MKKILLSVIAIMFFSGVCFSMNNSTTTIRNNSEDVFNTAITMNDFWVEVSRKPIAIKCELCGEGSIYYEVTEHYIYASDCYPPIPNRDYNIGLEGWAVLPWITAHNECLHKRLLRRN